MSLWKSPLDKVAVAEAEILAERQPRCTITFTTDFSAITAYNFGFYGAVPGGTATANNAALTGMFNAMNSATPIGGLAFIEQFTFPVSASSTGFSVPNQSNIIGMGGGGRNASGPPPPDFYHFTVTPTGGITPSVLFNCSGGHTTGGTYFRSLAFFWQATSNLADTCIEANTENTRAINCTFTNCPTAFTTSAISCTLEQCTIDYNITSSAGPNGVTAVIIDGQECGVLGPCAMLQLSRNKGGATGCTCIAILGAAEHAIIADCHISDWSVGIDFSQATGSVHTQIRNCEMQVWVSALNIQLPASHGGTTAGIKVTSCTLAKSQSSPDASPVVNIDAQLSSGNTNSQLSDISLIDCSVFSEYPTPPAGQHGLVIASGQNIKIIGGMYSNNSNNGGAGIAITGSCGDVQIMGASLRPHYDGAANLNNQQYALLVSGSPSNPILVSGCDMSGYTSPVNVSGSPTDLLIVNCPGYNDQNTTIASGVSLAPASNTHAANASSLGGTSVNYFGPSLVIFTNTGANLTFTINGTIASTVPPSGFVVYYIASPYDNIKFGHPPLSFTWLGK